MNNPYMKAEKKEEVSSNPYMEAETQFKSNKLPPLTEEESYRLSDAGYNPTLIRESQPGVEGTDISPVNNLLTVLGLGQGIGTIPRQTMTLWEKLATIRSAKGIEKLRPVEDILKTVPLTVKEVKQPLAAVKGVQVGAKGIAELTEAEKFSASLSKPTPLKSSTELDETFKQTKVKEKAALSQEQFLSKTGKEVSEGWIPGEIPSIKKGEIPSIKPGFSSRSLSKEGFDELIKHETPPPIGLVERAKRVGGGLYDDINKLIGSPYSSANLAKHPLGLEIWKTQDRAERAGMSWLDKELKEYSQNVKVLKGTPASDKVGDLLDQYETWEEIPSYIQNFYTKAEKESFIYLRNKFSEHWDNLVKEGVVDPTKTKKIKNYLFHIFDKDTIAKAWINERDDLLGVASKIGLDEKASATLKDKIAKLDKSINNYNATGTILYDYIPDSLSIPFLKERKGASGYSMDAAHAYESWLYFARKKKFTEPALQESVELMKQLPSYDQRNYARWFLRNQMDMERAIAPTIRQLERFVTGAEFIKGMGLSPRSAVVNLTQGLNTAVEIGPYWTAKGAYKALFDPKSKQLWNESGHAIEIPGMYKFVTQPEKKTWMDTITKGMDDVTKKSFYLFDKVELFNRRTAYSGSYEKAIAQGKLPEVAKAIADDTVRDTQFIYGKLGMPRAYYFPGGAVGMQYTTFAIKQAELFRDWAVKNPAKLAKYLIGATAAQEGAEHLLGIDISNAIGIGVDPHELVAAIYHLGKGDTTSANLHYKMGAPDIPLIGGERSGAGIFPSREGGLPASINTIKGIIQGEWEKQLPVSPKRAYESISASLSKPVPTLEGEEGYPITDIKTDEVKYKETPLQLLGRQFVKPMAETRAQKEVLMKRLEDEVYYKQLGKAIRASAKGNDKVASEIADKYNIFPSPEQIREQFMKYTYTPSERAKIEQWMNNRKSIFKYKIGQYPGQMP